MGASAFIMAKPPAKKYSTIALAALLPALLYYISVIAQVHFSCPTSVISRVYQRSTATTEISDERTRTYVHSNYRFGCIFNVDPYRSLCSKLHYLNYHCCQLVAQRNQNGVKEIIEALRRRRRTVIAGNGSLCRSRDYHRCSQPHQFGTVMTSYIVTFGAGSYCSH